MFIFNLFLDNIINPMSGTDNKMKWHTFFELK